MSATIKLTSYPAKDKYVVNTPGTHLQRYPRTYKSLSRAQDRIDELIQLAPGAVLVEDPK